MVTYAKHIATYVSASLNSERGATAIEYGLIAAGIAIVIIAAVGAVGTALTNMFTTIKTSL